MFWQPTRFRLTYDHQISIKRIEKNIPVTLSIPYQPQLCLNAFITHQIGKLPPRLQNGPFLRRTVTFEYLPDSALATGKAVV